MLAIHESAFYSVQILESSGKRAKELRNRANPPAPGGGGGHRAGVQRYTAAMAEPAAAATDLAALENFVAECDELRDLEALIGRFNIFDALGVVEAEIRHSNFLAWLLDPAESHGQGPLFLKAVLMDLLKRAGEEGLPRVLSPVELDSDDLQGVEVRREWRSIEVLRHGGTLSSIDLLITCEKPKFVIAIENKVYAGEGEGQLQRYRAIVEAEFSQLPRQFVFLTREGDGPSDEAWTTYSYTMLHQVLKRARNANANSIGDDVLTFLDHYLSVIGSRFMSSPDIDKLCKTIYEKHRQAINLVWERGRSDPVPTEMLNDAIRGDGRFEIVKESGRTIVFIPKSWQILSTRDGPEGTARPWIKWIVWADRLECKAIVEVGPSNDRSLRERVIKRLIEVEAKYGYKLSNRKIKPNYTRIRGKAIAKWESDRPKPDEVAARFQKLINEWYMQLDGLQNDLLPVTSQPQ